MLSLVNDHIRHCERRLAECILEVADELRLLDPADLVAWLRGRRFGNIAALVAASAELTFKPGALRFAMSGDATLDWSGRLAIRLDMELHHGGVDCFFSQHFDATRTEVVITYLLVDGAPCLSAAAAERFVAAVCDARKLDATE